MKQLTIIIIILLTHTFSVSPETINCKYDITTFYWQSNENIYMCIVENDKIFNGTRLTIDSATGRFYYKKNHNDVQGFKLNQPKVKEFPLNIQNIFPNLTMLDFWMCGFTELRGDDMKVFTKLKFLYMGINDITTIAEDTFSQNTNLEVIMLYHNKISHIDPKAFSNLHNLRALSLEGNLCKNLNMTMTRQQVEVAVKSIEDGCAC
jgi:hypothetical protein